MACKAALFYQPKLRLNLKLFAFLGSSKLNTRHSSHRQHYKQLLQQPFPPGCASQEQGGLRVHQPHDREREGGWGQGGRDRAAGCVVPGRRGGRIRKALIEENLLDAVIGLPDKLFFGTGIAAVILLFKKGRSTKDVLFIDASREFVEGTNQNKLGGEHIKKIVATYRAFQTVPKYAYRATPEEIAENDFNLNIPRYVDTFEPEKAVDLKAVEGEIARLEGELAGVRKQMARYLKDIGL